MSNILLNYQSKFKDRIEDFWNFWFRKNRYKYRSVVGFVHAAYKSKNLNVNKRPISAVADNNEVRNAKKIIVKINKKISFNLLYDKKNSLHKKINIEQLRRETFTS